jgi:ferrous iron transport protein A
MSVAQSLDLTLPEDTAPGDAVPLSALRRGAKGVIVRVGVEADAELERRLLELGFVEGARVELLHEGLLGRDPIAIRLDERCVALRRREARSILVSLESKR